MAKAKKTPTLEIIIAIGAVIFMFALVGILNPTKLLSDTAGDLGIQGAGDAMEKPDESMKEAGDSTEKADREVTELTSSETTTVIVEQPRSVPDTGTRLTSSSWGFEVMDEAV